MVKYVSFTQAMDWVVQYQKAFVDQHKPDLPLLEIYLGQLKIQSNEML